MQPTLDLAEAQSQGLIWDGDLLLFRRRSVISVYGRGEYSHAAMAAWWGYDLYVLESREWYGTRAVRLDNYLERLPVGVDVYRPQCEPRQRPAAVCEARRKLGRPYAYRNVLRAGLTHVPGARFFLPIDTDDDGRSPLYGEHPDKSDEPEFREHCSQFYNSSWRIGARIDWVPRLPDYLTEPNDLARSCGMVFQFNVVAGGPNAAR